MELLADQHAADEHALVVRIDYTNWRGERSLRRVVPQRLYIAEVEWHPGVQWILDAWDVDKQAVRSFAMKDIQAWAPEGSNAALLSG